MDIDILKYYNNTNASNEVHAGTSFEKIEAMKTYYGKMVDLAKQKNNSVDGLGISNFLNLKKDVVKTDDVKTSLNPFISSNTGGTGALNPEEAFVYENLNNEVSKKFLEMYYTLYMSPTEGDAKWRLGDIIGIHMSDDDAGGQLNELGEIDTRSNLKVYFDTKYWDGKSGQMQKRNMYYANMLFPPYYTSQEKLTEDLPRNDITEDMAQNSARLGTYFDSSRMMLKREGFTYRGESFKAVNDNITYLQWLIERSLGLVSTYLTDWDMSIYLQENMLGLNPDGVETPLMLNHRICEDSPLSQHVIDSSGNVSRKDDYFIEAKASTYGVVNYAVSKTNHRCEHLFSPGNFPLSNYWWPYVKGVDWDYQFAYVEDSTLGTKTPVPFLSIYNDLLNITDAKKMYVTETGLGTGNVMVLSEEKAYRKHNFDNFNSPTKNLSFFDRIKAVDYYNMAMSIWPSLEYMQYYQTCYNTPQDGLSDTDLYFTDLLDSIQGVDYGIPKEYDVTVRDIVNEQFSSMLSKGGSDINSSPADMGSSSTSTGGIKKSDFLKWMIGKKKKPSAPDVSNMNTSGSASTDLFTDSLQASATTAEGAEKKQQESSTLGKQVGLNRFSPILFGGPHGSNISPLTVQAYFQERNVHLENTPRIEVDTLKNFDDKNQSNYFKGLSSRYKYAGSEAASHYRYPYYNHQSPGKTVNLMKNGLNSWTYGRAYTEKLISKPIFATYSYARYSSSSSYSSYYYYLNWPTYTGSLGSRISYASSSYNYTIKYSYSSLSRWGSYYNSYWGSYNSYYYNGSRSYWGNGYNGYGYYTGVYTAWRMGTYAERIFTTYKRYLVHDEPDMKWTIKPHQFQTFSTYQWYAVYWSIWYMYNLIHIFSFLSARRNYNQGLIRNNIGMYNILLHTDTKYIINFSSEVEKARFYSKMMCAGTGKDQNVSLFFCEGNLSTRYTKGPSSIFRAPVRKFSYPEFYRYYYRYRYRHWCHSHWRTVVRYIAKWKTDFIVDMRFVDFFADNLSANPYSNKDKGSIDNPIQFDDITTAKAGRVNDEILNKLTYKGLDFKHTGALPYGFPFWSFSIYGLGGIGILSKLPGIDPIIEDTQFELFSHVMKAPYIPQNKKFSYKYRLQQMYYYRWHCWWHRYRRYSYWIWVPYKVYESDESYISRTKKITNEASLTVSTTKIQDVKWRTHTLTSRVFAQGVAQGQVYFVEDGIAYYDSSPMDKGLRNAITNLYSRSTFFRNESTVNLQNATEVSQIISEGIDINVIKDFKQGFIIDNSNPFRTLLSMAAQQSSALKILKNNLFDNISFLAIRKLIENYVDKCVVKACGYYYYTVAASEKERYKADPDHILYNYFLRKLCDIVGDKNPVVESLQRNRIETLFNERISTYDNIVDKFSELCIKDAKEWTLDDFKKASEYVLGLKTIAAVSNDLEDYILGYMQILYYYRYYFLTKRMNKEDGSLWLMRALESVVKFVAPSKLVVGPVPVKSLTEESKEYNVVFTKVQNSTLSKKEAIISGATLDVDRIFAVFIKVDWTTKEAYNTYMSLSDEEKLTTQEVVQITQDGLTRYANKPKNGPYKLLSKEIIDNEANILFNSKSENKQLLKPVYDYETALIDITWKHVDHDIVRGPAVYDATPILFNVFEGINTSTLGDFSLDYIEGSVSTEEVVCLCEETSDFWTVYVPQDRWPKAAGVQTKVFIKYYDQTLIEENSDVSNDINYALFGPQAYSLSPVVATSGPQIPTEMLSDMVLDSYGYDTLPI